MALPSISEFETFGKRAKRKLSERRSDGPNRPCVYFVQYGQRDCFKVGAANNMRYRLRHLQIATPETLYLAGMVFCDTRDAATVVEGAIHAALSAKGFDRKGEWFTMPWASAIATIHAAKDMPGVAGICAGANDDETPDEEWSAFKDAARKVRRYRGLCRDIL